MGLFNFYTKAKKKLTDTLGGLGDVANSFRNDLSSGIHNAENNVYNGARSVMDFSQPKIQSFQDNYVKPVESFVKKNPTPYSYVAPKVAGAVKTAYGAAGDAWNNPMKINKPLERTSYFKPTQNVRTRDVVREIPGAVASTAKDMFSGTANLITKAPKIAGEGLAYATSKNVREQYKKGNTDILPTVTDTTPESMLADTGRSMLEVATAGKTPKALGWMANASKLKRAAAGTGVGYGFDVMGNISNDGKVKKESFIPGMGTAMGGAFALAAPPLAKGIKNETEKIVRDLKTLPESKRTIIIPASKENISRDIVDSNAGRGRFATNSSTGKLEKIDGFQYSHKEGSFSYPEQKIIDPWKPESAIFNFRPGLNTKDVSTVADRVAQKRAQAKSLVTKQIDNQKKGLPVAEKGFLAPQNVPVPEKKSIPPIEEYVNGKTSGKADVKKILDDQFASFGPEGPSATPDWIIKKNQMREKVARKIADQDSRDKLPNIEEFVNGQSEKKPLPSIDEYVSKRTGEIISPETVSQGKPFNQFQQRAYDAKNDRMNALGQVLNYQNDLMKIGFNKKEIAKIGSEQAQKILKLADLGYPKNAMPKDLLSDQVSRIIKKGVSWTQLKDYYARKEALNTNFLDGIDPKTLKDINPLMVGGRDVYRNFEAAFGKNYPKIKQQLLDPFDEAKGRMIAEQKDLADEVFDQIVVKLGIKKGSDLDHAVVNFGEGKISLEELQRQFPKDWQKVFDADQWFRNKYPGLLNDLNAVREEIAPTHPLYPESSKKILARGSYYRHGKDLQGFTGLKNMFESPSNIDPSLAASSDVTNPKTKWLSFAQKRKGDENDFGAVEGYLDYIQNHSYAKHIDPYIQRFKGVDDEAKEMIPRGAFSPGNERRGLAEELSQKMDPVQQITESTDPENIKQILMDKDVSEPQAEWMSKELANIPNYEKTVSYLKNKLKKNTGKQLENLGTATSPAEKAENKENNFLVFIKNFSRDLAGKTNPVDRPFQENFFGRKALNIANWANSRFKANAVLGNASSSLAQFFNIPQGFASAGVRNSGKAIGGTLASIFKEAGPIQNSSFIRERYFNGFNKFDNSILDNTKNFAAWMTGIGDKIGTKFIWNAHYQKALSEGVSNPIKYADDWTRKMVAGRGIGEVPIAQKSKIVQLLAPFQLEVANMWYALRDVAKDDPRKLIVAKKMVEFTAASFLMNRLVKEVRGADVSFDPMNAMMEAYQEFQDEDSKLKGVVKAGGRIAGEVVSNVPGGQSIAAMYPEFGFGIDKENYPTLAKVLNNPRKEFFGEGDPTRFGTGGLPAYSAIKNPLTGFVLPYGGKQVEKTYSGVKSLMQGYAENNTGKVMTPIERDVPNIMKGVLFGKNALGEVQDYFSNDSLPLSDLQTEKYKLMGNSPEYFNKIANERKTNKEKEALKTGKTAGENGELLEGMSKLSNGSIYVKSLDKEFKTIKEASMAVAMDDLSSSEENFRDLGNGLVLRKGEDGNVIKQRRDAYDSGLNNAKLSGYKRNKNLAGWKETADKQLALLSKMMMDPSIDDLDKTKIQNTLDTLSSEYSKYGGYGGFTKGKKAPKLEEKYRYPLVDVDMMKIKSLLAGGGGGKFRMVRKPMPLIFRKAPAVHRTRRR